MLYIPILIFIVFYLYFFQYNILITMTKDLFVLTLHNLQCQHILSAVLESDWSIGSMDVSQCIRQKWACAIHLLSNHHNNTIQDYILIQ